MNVKNVLIKTFYKGSKLSFCASNFQRIDNEKNICFLSLTNNVVCSL